MPPQELVRLNHGKSPFKLKFHKILIEIEMEVFYDGYYFAVAFTESPCKEIFLP